MEHQVITLLDELAALVAETDDGPRLPALRAVVADVEAFAHAPLGEVDDEPAAVLHRRFARAHRLLLRGERVEIAERLGLLLETLQPDHRRPARTTQTAGAATARAMIPRPAGWDAAMSRTG